MWSLFARCGLSLTLQRQSAQVRERVVANLLGAAATASKRLPVMAAMASEQLAVTEAISNRCIGCEAAMFAARRRKRL